MAGFYGKLVARGDFVSRGIDNQVIGLLDEWFQLGMLTSKQQLAKDWMGYYQVAPIWHYYISPGVINEQAWVGTWIPSADKVNRHFPLTLIAPINVPHTKLIQAHQYSSWFEQNEDLLLAALESTLNFDWFCQQVEGHHPYKDIKDEQLIDQAFTEEEGEEQISPNAESSQFQTQPPDFEQLSPIEQKVFALEKAVKTIAEHLNLDVGLADDIVEIKQQMQSEKPQEQVDMPQYNEFDFDINLAGSINVVKDCEIDTDTEPYCVWLSEGNDTIAPQFAVSKGLPAKAIFSRFLTGFE